MKKTFRFFNLIMLVLLFGFTSIIIAADDGVNAHQAWKNSGGKARIVLDSDGNHHDTDDWAAAAATLAIIANQGLKDNVVAYTFSNHLWDQWDNGDKNMDLSVLETAKKFGYDLVAQNFIDAYSHREAAYNAIRDAINASSANDPLFMILAGPMEVAWQGIKRSEQSKRKYVYCISHSWWNDVHAKKDHGGHEWDQLDDLGVNVDHITDQNGNRFNTGNMSSWNFLKTLADRTNDGYDEAYNYTYERIDAAYSAGDASDCGMVYYLFTGDEDGNTTRLNNFMSNPPISNGPKVAITKPTTGDIVEEGTNIIVKGTATDADGNVSKIECFDNGTKIGAATSSPFSFTLTNPSVGEHTIKVVATDNEGKKGQRTITVRVSGCSGENAKIEAENYLAMSGIQTETVSDNGGGLNVGWVDDGDWMEYCVKIPSNGIYKLELRVASVNNGGKVQILLGGNSKTTCDVPNTDGWQNWKTVETTNFNATAGNKTLRLKATKGGFNINWLVLKPAKAQTEYALSVNSGNGDGEYVEGAIVNITANASPAGKVFAKWIGDVGVVANANSATTTLTMPAKATSVTATYKNAGATTDITLSPIQDAYLEGSTRYNSELIRIESGKRVGYLMYDLSSITGTITSAKLKLTCTGDAGNGNINVNLGSSSDWTEANLSNSNKPSAGIKLGSLNSNYNIGTTYTWNLAASSVVAGGKVNLIVTSTGGNDVAFASKETSGKAPKLVVTYNRSGSKAASEGNRNMDNKLSIYPNPANNQLFIDLKSELVDGAQINVLNSAGTLVRSELMTEQAVLNISDLSLGIYMIQVINGDKVYVNRIIKE